MKTAILIFFMALVSQAFQCGEYEIKGQLKVYPQSLKLELKPGTRARSKIDLENLNPIYQQVYQDKYISVNVKMNSSLSGESLSAPTIIPQADTLKPSSFRLIKKFPCP